LGLLGCEIGDLGQLGQLGHLGQIHEELAKSVEIGQNPSNWPRSLFLANSNIIGTIAVFGRHGVTWGHMGSHGVTWQSWPSDAK